jgi:hypothetical protein
MNPGILEFLPTVNKCNQVTSVATAYVDKSLDRIVTKTQNHYLTLVGMYVACALTAFLVTLIEQS